MAINFLKEVIWLDFLAGLIMLIQINNRSTKESWIRDIIGLDALSDLQSKQTDSNYLYCFMLSNFNL